MQAQFVIEAADTTSEQREIANLHLDRKAKVMNESFNDLTGESVNANRTWMFINDQYLAVENNVQKGSKMMTEGTREFVTTESLASLHLWQSFHDLLVSNECIPHANTNLDPLELSISLFETDSNRAEMQKVREIIRSPETSFMSKIEVMKALLARNTILQNWWYWTIA